jgi:integrase
MPAHRKGARVLKPKPVAGRNRWRVVVFGPDGRRAARETDEHTGAPFTEADAWAFYRKISDRLKALGELTVGKTIVQFLKRKLRTEEQSQASSIEEAERQLKSFFKGRLNMRLGAVTPKVCDWQYLGRYNDDGDLVEHGAVTRPRHDAPDDDPHCKEHHFYAECEHRRAGATHQNELRTAKSFLKWCVQKGFIASNPAAGVDKVGKRKRGKKKLNIEETMKFIEVGMDMAAEGDLGALAAVLALVLAMRAGEVLGLVPRALDMDFTIVKVLRGKTDPSERSLALPMEFPVGRFLQECLRQLCAGRGRDDLIFPSERGGRRRRKWLWEATRRVCARADVTVVSTHGLRGTHLTHAEEAGATASVMMRQGGHSREVQRRHYLAAGSEERGAQARFKAALAGLGVVDGGKRKAPQETIAWRQRSRGPSKKDAG